MRVRKPSAILFDLDGVLWKTKNIHRNAFEIVCSSMGLKCPEYSTIAGVNSPEAIRQILKLNSIEDSLYETLVPRLVSEKQQASRQLLVEATATQLELWTDFDWTSGIPIAMVTGSSPNTVQLYLDKLGNNPFEVIICGESVLPKPNPQGFLSAIEKLNSHIQNTIIFEDSPSGITAAIRSGSPYVHVYGDWEKCQFKHEGATFFACIESLSNFKEKITFV